MLPAGPALHRGLHFLGPALHWGLPFPGPALRWAYPSLGLPFIKPALCWFCTSPGLPFLGPPFPGPGFPEPALRQAALPQATLPQAAIPRACPSTGRQSPGYPSLGLPFVCPSFTGTGSSLRQAPPNHPFPLRCARHWVTFFSVRLGPVMSVPDLGLWHSFLPSPFAGSPFGARPTQSPIHVLPTPGGPLPWVFTVLSTLIRLPCRLPPPRLTYGSLTLGTLAYHREAEVFPVNMLIEACNCPIYWAYGTSRW